MPLPNAEESVVAPTASEKLETMASRGEIELIPEEPSTETEETPEVEQPSKVVLRGKEYSEEEVMSLIQRGQNSINDENWQKTNTQKSMALAEEKRQVEADRARMKQEFDDMRKGAEGDPAMQKVINLLELQRERETALERSNAELKMEIQTQKNTQAILEDKARAEAELGEKLPEYGSPEFDKLIQLAANGNRLAMAYQLSKRLSSKKQLPNLKDTGSRSSKEPNVSQEMESAIANSGLDPEFVKSLM